MSPDEQRAILDFWLEAMDLASEVRLRRLEALMSAVEDHGHNAFDGRLLLRLAADVLPKDDALAAARTLLAQFREQLISARDHLGTVEVR